MKKVEEMTIKEVIEERATAKQRDSELCSFLNEVTEEVETTKAKVKEINHGWCIVILDKGFIYLGELITRGRFLTVNEVSNIRYYSSGKGLLWHAKNGPKDMTLDKYEGGHLGAPFSELKHFVPTDKKLWI